MNDDAQYAGLATYYLDAANDVINHSGARREPMKKYEFVEVEKKHSP
jgi:hypothetical protein